MNSWIYKLLEKIFQIEILFFQAVLIDMEEGVVNEILQGPLRDVFDSKQLITDISGSGNNWWEHIQCHLKKLSIHCLVLIGPAVMKAKCNLPHKSICLVF